MDRGARRLSRPRRLAVLAGVLFLALGAFAFFLRFADGPVVVFPGGPLRSGELVDYDAIDWASLARLRELELQLESPARSRITWFTVYEGRPYISCGFGCEGGWVKRWPYYVERDDRVVLRIDGVRIRARMQRVEHASDEYVAVRAAGARKFGGESDARETVEGRAARAVVQLGRGLTGEAVSEETSRRLYRVVAR